MRAKHILNPYLSLRCVLLFYHRTLVKTKQKKSENLVNNFCVRNSIITDYIYIRQTLLKEGMSPMWN